MSPADVQMKRAHRLGLHYLRPSRACPLCAKAGVA